MENTHHKPDNFMRNLFISLLVIIGLLLGFNYWQTSKTEAPTGDIPAVVQTQNMVRPQDHFIGKADAKVVLTEYADLQCPSCKAFEPILTKLAATKSNESFAYVYRYFPLINIHSHALLAAHYNEAASIQGKFWEMNHLLYDKQSEWGEALDAEAKIKGYAQSIGLNVDKLVADANSADVDAKVKASLAEANKLGLTSTPSLLINGVKITIKSEQDLSSQIDTAIANSKNIITAPVKNK